MSEEQTVPNEAPTRLSRKWVRYMLGFGVSVALGLLPFLGLVGVPGFTPLLSLFPKVPFDTTVRIIPLSSFVMGVVCLIVQFLSHERLSRAYLRQLFKWSAVGVVLATVLLLVIHTLVVVQVKMPAIGQDAEIAVLLSYSRLDSCEECEPEMSDVECLSHTTLDPAKIRSCWGDRNIRIAFLILAFPYFIMTAGFGVMVGGLVLREELKLKGGTSSN